MWLCENYIKAILYDLYSRQIWNKIYKIMKNKKFIEKYTYVLLNHLMFSILRETQYYK